MESVDTYLSPTVGFNMPCYPAICNRPWLCAPIHCCSPRYRM
uniref:Uncharacterized protein n=1 Tax=Utricularia reniformis TaxID=192314 RepID=A0A1Y0B3G3_9LAMI|nr:hypothetical protein AEK19_MT1698 [Utricularia reniformis]ART31879.1 hypothetical protein AEK19_MT1698 [Utricularia reniformis]